MLVDPHTAVGLGAAAICRADPTVPMVAMATAHPAKFPDAVEAATGVRPPLPDRLAGLFDRPERYDTVPADYVTVRDATRRHRLTEPAVTRPRRNRASGIPGMMRR